MRSILRFAFVVVPTAALFGALVLGTSGRVKAATQIADGDLQRDLQLAGTASIELAPTARSLVAVSPIEVLPAVAPKGVARPKQTRSPKRVVRSRPAAGPVVEVAEVADGIEDSVIATSIAEADVGTEVAAEAGGVALPRPTGLPGMPAPGADEAVGDERGSGGGSVLGGVFGTILRGGGSAGDPCRIHTGGGHVYGRPRARSSGTSERVRENVRRRPDSNSGLAGRVREATGRRSGDGERSSSRGSVSERVRRVSRQ